MTILSDPVAIITWVVTVAIPAVIAIITAYKNKGLKGAFTALCNLMNPYVPQTAEQTALIEKKAVPDATWKMTSDSIYQMWRELVAGRANITHDALKRTVEDAEKEEQVEYIIVTHDNDGKAETEPLYAFISYGTYTVADKDTIEKMSFEHGGVKKYYLGC